MVEKIGKEKISRKRIGTRDMFGYSCVCFPDIFDKFYF